MKSLVESLFDSNTQTMESLFDKDSVKKKTVPEKLAYVLRKFFGDDIALCVDYRGNHTWYEINPETMQYGANKYVLDRFVKYCKKVEGLYVKEDKVNFDYIRGYVVGDDDYWASIETPGKSFSRVRVNKSFYESGILPHDQRGVTRRGWEEWQKQRL